MTNAATVASAMVETVAKVDPETGTVRTVEVPGGTLGVALHGIGAVADVAGDLVLGVTGLLGDLLLGLADALAVGPAHAVLHHAAQRSVDVAYREEPTPSLYSHATIAYVECKKCKADAPIKSHLRPAHSCAQNRQER